MIIKRLELHNYMIHRDFAADFSGNLIALTGEMGHGKSTFVGALQFCLTGEHPPWRREDLVSWGEMEGSAKLYFTHNGVDCSIYRKLQCSETVLKIGDEVINGARNTEKALLERMGIDKEVMKQVGFIQQCEIQTILFDEPAKRERTYQKLIGLDRCSKIYSEMGPIIQSYSNPENFDASIEYLKQAINKLGVELEAIDKTLEVSRKAMSLMPSREEMQLEMQRLTKVQSTLTLLSVTRSTMQRRNSEMDAAMSAYTKLEADRRDAMNALGCSPEEMEKAIASLKSSHDTALAELNNMRRLSEVSDSNGECPLCGTHVMAGQITKHTTAELERLGRTEQDTRALFEETNAEFIKIKSRLLYIDNEIARLKSQLASYSAVIESEKIKERALLEEFAGLGISPEQATIDQLSMSVNTDLQNCYATSSKYDDLNSQINMLQGEKNAKSQQLKQASEALDAKTKEKALQAPIAAKLEKLQAVREWFHSSNGPRTIALNTMKEMTVYVNEYLRKLNSEIEVVLDNQGLSFSFYYVDGRQVSDPLPSAAKLSGGQKISLSLAFIFANYMYFGQKIGVMVLDEPTAHLSPAGVAYFGLMLQTVSTLAKNMNLQILMPTHEKEILPFMDSEIHFD